MYIKLLCVNTVSIQYDYYGENYFTIEEGNTVKTLMNEEGVRFEYDKNCYTLPYRFEDVEKNFISAFDEDSYNKIYQKVHDLTMHFEDGTSIVLGDAIGKIKYV